MERRRSKSVLSRREILLGAAAFSAGILTALGGVNVYEQIRNENSAEKAPLRPNSGEAEPKLAIAWLPDTVKRWQPKIEKYSDEYDIDPNLMAIMMTVESGGDPNADSGVARGLMQITDPTAEDINNRIMAPEKKKAEYDLRDPDTSMEFAAAYISQLIAQYGAADQAPTWDETVTVVSAGYNGGYVAANLYRDEQWQGLEKYDRQTFNYARYVRTMWQERHDPLSFSYRHWFDTGNGKALVENAAKYELK
jgi:soluble lytic murein transglycosylase-like protein